MRRGIFWIFPAILIGGIFLFAKLSLAAASDMVINEVAAYETAGHEWVEIYNRGRAPVDLTGWKFWENNTNHGLILFQGEDLIIDTGEYAIIADNAANLKSDYLDFGGTIMDSTFSLSESGEEIGLKTSSDAASVVESFVYLSAPNFSLERANPNLNDYTVANWQENTVGNTFGRQNSNYTIGTPLANLPPVAAAGVDQNVFVGESINFDGSASIDTDGTIANYFWDFGDGNTAIGVTTTHSYLTAGNFSVSLVVTDNIGATFSDNALITVMAANTTPTTTSSTFNTGDVTINEFVANPSDGEKEWVEFFNNTTSTIDLSGWSLCDNSSTSTLSGLVAASSTNKFFVFEFASAKLNNDGDIITLKDATGKIIDQIVYGNWDDGNSADNIAAPGKGYAMAREADGTGNFSETITPTKNQSNIITPRPVISSGGGGGSTINNNATNNNQEIVLNQGNFSGVSINELLPNPSAGTNQEFIELKNINTYPVNLAGWYLIDLSGSKFVFSSSTITASGLVAVYRSQSEIALNNSGAETVKLFSPDKNLVSEISYSGRTENDQAFAYSSSTWLWTDEPTPGAENIILIKDFSPQAQINFTADNLYVDEPVVFDASASADPRDQDLKYRWDFGDGKTSNRQIVSHRFSSSGNYTIGLKVINESGASSTAQIFLKITAAPEESTTLNTKKSTSKKLITAFSDLTDVSSGDEVRLNGVVSVLPGFFSTQFFYVQDITSSTSRGLQVYSSQKDFPKLKIGDQIAVSGVISFSGGEPRVKLKNKGDIKIIQSGKNLLPHVLAIGDISEEYAGGLITISGEIIEHRSGAIFLDDDSGEIEVAIKRGTAIKGLSITDGQHLTVSGVLVLNSSGYQLWPRAMADLVFGAVKGASEIATSTAEQQPRYSPLIKYFVSLFVVGIGLSGWWFLRKK